MIFALALMLALQPPAEPPPEEWEPPTSLPVRMTPLTAPRALDAFKSLCMDTFPDPAAFDAAVAASDLGFARGESTEDRAQQWTSPHGQITYRYAPRRRETREDRRLRRAGEMPSRHRRWTLRCDFWVALRESVPTPELIAAVGTQLLGGRVQPAEDIIGTTWDMGSSGGFSLRLVLIPASEDNRVITLSIQQIPEGPPR